MSSSSSSQSQQQQQQQHHSSPSPSSLCPIGKVLAATLDASFVAALLISADDGKVLYNNLHALLLLGDDYQSSQDDDLINEEEQQQQESHHVFSRWIELPRPMTWEDVVDRLKNDTTAEERSKGNEGGKLTNILGALKKDGTNVTINFALMPSGGDDTDNNNNKYVVAYLKTDTAALSVDEVTALQLDKDLVDGSFDPMFVIDDEGTILMMNEASSKLFGYSYGELLHHNISIICGAGHGSGDKHKQYMQNYFTTGIKKVIGKIRKTHAKRKDGSEFPVELGVREIKSSDGTHQRLFCGYVKDMTVAETHEKELLHRESLMQGMINSSFDPMFQINEKGIICMINNAAIHLFGYEGREELVGQNISIICGGGHACHHDQYLKRYLETGVKKIIGRKRKVPAVRKDGTEFDVELGINEVTCNDTGERVFCGYIRDLTQERLSRRLLQRKEAEMQGRFFGSGGGDK